MSTKRTIIPKDARIFLTWELQGDHWLDWKTYLVEAYERDANGLWTVPVYLRAAPNPQMDTTPTLSEAAVFAEGFIKWDGCFQFEFPGHLHFDSKADTLATLTHMVEMVYAAAEEHMPTFDAELAR